MDGRDDLKPIDKAIERVVSESPGCNVSERKGSLERVNPEAEPFPLRRRQQEPPSSGCGGIPPAGCERRHGDKDAQSNWGSPPAPAGKRRSKVHRTTGRHREAAKARGVEDGPETARKRGNARGAKGPCCTCSSVAREAGAE